MLHHHLGAQTPRSRLGCLTCRRRKLKCDERKPCCHQCTKSARECEYPDGVTFRHQQNASLNNEDIVSGQLGSYYGYRQSFSPDQPWMIPEEKLQFRFVYDPTTDADRELPTTPLPTLDEEMHDHDDELTDYVHVKREPSAESVRDLQAARNQPSITAQIASHESRRYERVKNVTADKKVEIRFRAINGSASGSSISPQTTSPRSIKQEHSPGTSVHGSSPRSNIPHSFDAMTINAMSPNSQANPADEAPATNAALCFELFDANTPQMDNSREVAFLMRHFTDYCGNSMDLFDRGRYFSSTVPMRAQDSLMIKYAACAYAAKQLGLVGGVKQPVGGVASIPAASENWPQRFSSQDWFHLAKQYVDASMVLLGPMTAQLIDKNRRRQSDLFALETVRSDLLVASAILLEYDCIDANAHGWTALVGASKTLLDGADTALEKNIASNKAIFWNLARQDCAASLISGNPTVIDATMSDKWRRAGLNIDNFGGNVVYPADKNDRNELGHFACHEDMMANTLIYILYQITNFICNNSGTQRYRESEWDRLFAEIQNWIQNTEKPFTTWNRIRSERYPIFEEHWFITGQCAAALGNFHLAIILLILNNPRAPLDYRTLRSQCSTPTWDRLQRASKTIVSISLSRPKAPVRIFLILPLLWAGRCLKKREERQVVHDLLAAIQVDLGWATNHLLASLEYDWQHETSLLQN